MLKIYLHYVLDLWVQQWRKKHARGQVYVVRYADDFVMGFQYEQDARSLRKALAERFAQFGLELHPEKTRTFRFGRFARNDSVKDGRARPETFDFLGFTHICAQGPQGQFRLVRRTSRKKRNAKLAALRKEMRRRMHDPAAEQHRWLSSVLRGHYRYYGVPGNYRALHSFGRHVRNAWHRMLQGRSQRARWTSAQRTQFERHLPLPERRILHPHPLQRFDERRAGP